MDVKMCSECLRWMPPEHFYPGGKPRCRAVTWTAARKWRLLELRDRGLTNAEIARELGVTKASLRSACTRLHIPSRRSIAFSLTDVARIMGVESRTARRWLDAGWLPAVRGRHWGRRLTWWITRDNFCKFLENEAGFHAWSPDQITDVRWRAYAEKTRGAIRWLTLAEVAYRAFVTKSAVQYWIRRGWIPARKIVGPKSAWRILESDFLSFTPPPIGGRSASARHAWRQDNERRFNETPGADVGRDSGQAARGRE